MPKKQPLTFRFKLIYKVKGAKCPKLQHHPYPNSYQIEQRREERTNAICLKKGTSVNIY